MAQRLQVKGQCVGGDTETLGDLARGHALGPRLNEDAIHLEATTLRKRAQGDDGGFRFHNSRIVESMSCVKPRESAGVHSSDQAGS